MTPDPLHRKAAAVYILQRRDRRRFKVGWALAPIQRIRHLPEFATGHLDLEHSVALWLPSRRRAEQIERAVHKCLAPYAAEVDHRSDGHSEWFKPAAHPMAVRLLAQMPADERTADRPGLAALESGELDATELREVGPQETWWALEDLWSRLAACIDLRVEVQGDAQNVVLVAFRHARDGAVGELRSHVLDSETYTWRLPGVRGEFVRLLDYRGDDLVCTLSTLRRIKSWPDGEELAWQVKAFLFRLERLSRAATAVEVACPAQQGILP